MGIPDSLYTYHEPEEDDNSQRPQIYLYNFHNVALKLSSTDRISIDSITIFPFENQPYVIEIVALQFEEDEGPTALGKSTINDEIISSVTKHYNLSSMTERLFAVEAYFGRWGGYFNYTFFVGETLPTNSYGTTDDIEMLRGEKIIGLCISNKEFSPFISSYEMR